MEDNKSVDDLVKILDGFASSDSGRLKVFMSDELEQGATKKEYHHGRCDINSPWAKGCAFDVLE